jgi:hypothetical protein
VKTPASPRAGKSVAHLFSILLVCLLMLVSGETTHAFGAATLVLGAPGGSSSPSSTGTGRVDDYFWIAAAFDFALIAGVLGDWLLLIEILR